MNKIVSKRHFSENVVELVIEAPLIAQSRRAGHFVIVRVDKGGERIPLTIADADTTQGTITLVVQQIGVSSRKLCALNIGDEVADIVGPLGKATRIEKYGTVVCACGGVGAAPMLPIAQALKKAGNKVITVLAARTKSLIILEEQLAQYSDEVIVMTDDGSYGTQGLVTQGVGNVIKREHVDKCITIGPAIMMKFVSLLTKQYDIPTEASLNTIMVDGTGMCGACRVTVGGKTRFVCVDGPEFDAHAVDFDEMLKRLGGYKAQEKEALEHYQANEQKACDTNTCRTTATTQTLSDSEISPTYADDNRDAEWRVALRKSMKPKERTAIERVQMPELDAAYRATTLTEEVNQGLSKEQALTEAKRCLDCVNPTCVQGCPVGINIPTFIKHIEAEDLKGAIQTIKKSSTLPAVCGRVCPQEKQCESRCIHLKMGNKPVAIGYLERFAADYEREQGCASIPQSAPKNGKKIAVIGSGPAGLTFAGDMAKYGYDVTVFEALHEIGGVLKYGIPEFRLPNKIVDAEIELLKQMGVKFKTDIIVGKTITVEDLQHEGYAGVFAGSGAGLPRFMNIPGENLTGVMSCNEYLTRVNLMSAYAENSDTPVLSGKRVAVIGGGNTAMDAVRTAKRLGAEEAMIVYRRSEEEMPARVEEVKHAKEEGVQFLTLHNPLSYSGDEQGHVQKMLLQIMELGEPDASGRRSPIAVEGKTVEKEVDLVIVSIGVSPNPILPRSIEGLEISPKGTIVVNDRMQSSLPILFAGGDIVRGGATVILAMSDGRKAAKAMNEALGE
ncbi:MAG: bifunctional dihydroorotate dehydrogenase B NAD binding subunit/NADPH-dependent glutamate synthase [Paludibacter sp.]|nr:bifunctional dihydroorotate dehydrogenase B NAD binding subunit/NADPH-dependent glutamate synthase [Bacteroidales bacterium]MCM1069366.1 bifunctional dihydroorotate dehydrogenase B NAD binding subunit/NADPH-dependent glutamate synthase [Prevotella sp.]MCM1353886.1 bifunctional dihydroorotate dehydrogenase B NAD binding subunit/NADPH-dependent glutamate synthase [Bacteroides sp.]MCM1442864.1 bifunctional dihydroorotate dehydrogenase B NAD binding subunit/NADPH-dependent glutamate synthase [Mur